MKNRKIPDVEFFKRIGEWGRHVGQIDKLEGSQVSACEASVRWESIVNKCSYAQANESAILYLFIGVLGIEGATARRRLGLMVDSQ